MGLRGSGSDNVLRSTYLEDRDVWSGGGVISSYFLERGDYFQARKRNPGLHRALEEPTHRRLAPLLRGSTQPIHNHGLPGTDPSAVTSTGITPGIDVTSAYPTATR